MNYSNQRVRKLIQGTNAASIPTQLNSVRHVAPYKGSMNPQDLLDLYVGNTHYRQVNKALRADDINTARQQVWDEEGLMKIKLGYDNISDDYFKMMKSMGLNENQIINTVNKKIELANNFINLDKTEDPPLFLYQKQMDTRFTEHPLAYNNYEFQNLPLIEQAEQVVAFGNNPIYKQPTIQDRVNAEQYFQQVLASAPHIEDALLKQPVHTINSVKEFYPKNSPISWIQQGYDHYDILDMLGDTTYHKNIDDLSSQYPFLSLPLEEQAKQVLAYQPTANLHTVEQDLTESLKSYAQNILDPNYKIQALEDGGYGSDVFLGHPLTNYYRTGGIKKDIYEPISRGLHFKNKVDYNNFINQHQVGSIVEYPAFTSTTILPDTQEGFASKRQGEIPVFQDIIPQPGSNIVNGRDVNNPAEGERLYPPGQRFKVVDSNQLNNGTQMVLQETLELPYKEQRVADILGRMKPRTAEIVRDKQKRRADFIKQGSGTYQTFIDGKMYKTLTPEQMQRAVSNTQNEGWQVSIK